MKLILEAAFDTFSGYGNDAVEMAIQLEKTGVDLTVLPMAILPGLPATFTDLLQRNPMGKKDLLVRYAWPNKLQAPTKFADVPKFAWSMWERTPMDDRDFDKPWFDEKTLDPMVGQDRMIGWDGMLVTCPMNVEAFRPILPESTPIGVVPTGIDPKKWPMQERQRGGPTKFLMVGVMNGRKDPFAMLDAWRAVKEQNPGWDATLRIHTLGPGLHPKMVDVYPDLTITSHAQTHEEMLTMYREADVLVSTSRGEGMNKPAMEFMSTGGVVMATDWSGHQNWLHPECTIPLPGTMAASETAPWAQEFRVDPEILMKELIGVEDRDLPRMGEVASGLVAASLSWESVIDRMLREVSRML